MTRLLGLPHVRELVNAPMFAFGQRAAHIAAKRAPMLEALIAAGANLNLVSEWENGTARLLLAGGVRLTPNAAARLGWIDELRQLLVANSHLVHARGGHGQQPLHEAATVAIADLLIQHGADVNDVALITSPRRRSTRSQNGRTCVVASPTRRRCRHIHAGSPRRCCVGDTCARC